MGLQSTHTANGASVLVIDQACDNDQLLISLSKNGTKWLSPVGWTEQQKVTLLDCRPNGETTEIDIPAEFASDITSGDVLVLRCSELDLEKEIIWEASDVETRIIEESVPAATSLAGGLLSRFKSSKAEVIEETKSEAQLRAEEADRAAQTYKAKMEAATAAKEDAQRKALEAAREAEAALKMEADRIAEMERAAKAFEEAERLKQDELRRVEEERRAEEARLAEEARRIEEARKREIAAKKEADRKAALERYQAALDFTQNEDVRLKSRLKDLKRQAKSDAANVAVQEKDLQSRRGLMVVTEETAAKRFDSYEKSASKLDVMNADLSLLQSESETLGTDRQALSIRLMQADTDYQQAQKEAESAMARAETRRAELDNIRQEESEVSERIASVSEKLTSQNQIVTSASEKTQKLQSKLESTQAELTQAKAEIEALEQALLAQAEKDQNLRLEIEATQQAIEDSHVREVKHREAIEHLEAGGAPEDIAEIDFEVRGLEPSSVSDDSSETNLMPPKTKNAGFMDRIRRNSARKKDAQISIDVKDVLVDAQEVDADSILLAGLDDTPSFLRRHGSSFMALGAVIGGIAILGGGYAVNKSASSKLEVKSTTPAPTQVASAVTKVELPKTSELTKIEAVEEVINTKAEGIEAEVTPITIDLSKIETPEIKSSKIESAKMETPDSKVGDAAVEADPKVEDIIMPAAIEESSFAVKLAEVVDPSGFAFELPDMMPVALSEEVDSQPVAKEAEIEKPAPKKQVSATSAPKTIEAEKAKVVKTAAIEKVQPKATPKVEADVNYPELTSDVQTRLFNLGIYDGDINGLQTKATKEAIINFKTLFAMPEIDDRITGALLTKLKQVQHEQEVAEIKAIEVAEQEANVAVQVAEATPSVDFYDTVQAVPVAPVITDSLPSTSSLPDSDPIPASVEPEPEPVQLASIPAVTEPSPSPAVQDVIVEAELTQNAGAKYPEMAERRNYYVDVNIVMTYDIDVSGRTTNIRIESNDHTGRFNTAFEKEAMRAIKKLRFKPKTVNGVPTESNDRVKRIVFRAG